MKKFAILLGLTVSFAMMVGCASKNTDQATDAPAPTAHHDVKGEVGTSK